MVEHPARSHPEYYATRPHGHPWVALIDAAVLTRMEVTREEPSGLSELVEERSDDFDVLDPPFLSAHPQLVLLEKFA